LTFFLVRFWAFLGEGSSKTRLKKYRKKNLTPVLFWPLTHPPPRAPILCLLLLLLLLLLLPAAGPRRRIWFI
jgi:hypothetical protein